MARLFLSHASEDEAMPAALVDALRQEGFEVWWDKDLKAGEAWAERIDLELGRADCVVICWSKIALKPGRHWVRGEAEK